MDNREIRETVERPAFSPMSSGPNDEVVKQEAIQARALAAWVETYGYLTPEQRLELTAAGVMGGTMFGPRFGSRVALNAVSGALPKRGGGRNIAEGLSSPALKD